jgi:hypothetical protein
MTTYIVPTSGQAYPDINEGALTQPNGSPAVAATSFAGPLLAGTVQHSDGSNNLASVGGTTGTANRTYSVQGMSCTITQATNDGTVGQFACPIVIPAQSQILRMYLMVTAVWSGTTTLGIGSGASATAFTTAAAVSGAALGQVSIVPGTSLTQIANWDNVGTQDVQIVILSGSTGTGTGTFTVEFIPQNNMAS